MNKQAVDELQSRLGISPEQIVREEYEMLILKQLFESSIGRVFVFKGGTALRLAYGSHWFSDDLDFSVVGAFDQAQLAAVLKRLAGEHDSVTLVETRRKRFTSFGLLRIREAFLPQALTIKFEASIKPVDWKEGEDFALLTLVSQVTSLTVLTQVATLERIKKEKQGIKRKRIRDIYDLWFIGNRLKEPKPMDFSGFSTTEVRRQLNKYLPFAQRALLDRWL